ncbi:MAG: EF-hand domain-containing protein [Deltaproteobacteria bacterium]|nr:EF-hand domain-containing protein [Deltaproteobacteria bacterium]
MAPETQELREVFEHFDRDGNGTIDPAELKALLEALGGGFTDEEVRIGLKEIDRNGNGKIEFSEFARWWTAR